MKTNKILMLMLVFLMLVIVLFSSVFSSGVFAQEDRLNVYASEAIKQKAFDVSKQIEIYLNANPNLTLEDLKNSAEFWEIAVQDVGETGYTYIITKETGILDFHPGQCF